MLKNVPGARAIAALWQGAKSRQTRGPEEGPFAVLAGGVLVGTLAREDLIAYRRAAVTDGRLWASLLLSLVGALLIVAVNTLRRVPLWFLVFAALPAFSAIVGHGHAPIMVEERNAAERFLDALAGATSLAFIHAFVWIAHHGGARYLGLREVFEEEVDRRVRLLLGLAEGVDLRYVPWTAVVPRRAGNNAGGSSEAGRDG